MTVTFRTHLYSWGIGVKWLFCFLLLFIYLEGQRNLLLFVGRNIKNTLFCQIVLKYLMIILEFSWLSNWNLCQGNPTKVVCCSTYEVLVYYLLLLEFWLDFVWDCLIILLFYCGFLWNLFDYYILFCQLHFTVLRGVELS